MTHSAPAWQDRADFIIGAPLPEPDRSEQLWARRLDDLRFEICCIPFFLYDVALGDIVQTNAAYDLQRVIKRSGRSVFRVWLGASLYPREDIERELTDLGLLERSSANLLAIDAADEQSAIQIATYLHAQEQAGRLTYETGRT